MCQRFRITWLFIKKGKLFFDATMGTELWLTKKSAYWTNIIFANDKISTAKGLACHLLMKGESLAWAKKTV